MLLDQVKATIVRHDLFRRGQHVLVGVSGGADSIALLALLNELARSWNLRITVAHLNHRIRGQAADADARFVRALARQLGIGYIENRKDVPRLARRHGISLEMAGREARYAFFVDAARQRHCDAAATAHTADDQAETILLKLTRGTGAHGLAGIPYITHWKNLKIVRPLRDIDRATIIQFLRRRRLAWREDATNANDAFLRNRIRHDMLPYLETKFNPRIRQALGRLADILEKENEWQDSLAKHILSACVLKPAALKTNATKRVPPRAQQTLGQQDGGLSGGCRIVAVPQRVFQHALDGQILVSHPQAARRRVLRQWLASCDVVPASMDFDAVDRLDNLLMTRQSGRAVTLPNGYVVRKCRQQLRLDSGKQAVTTAFRVPLKIPGKTRLPELGLGVTASLAPGIYREKPRGIGHYPARASLALTAWRRRRIIVRSWRPGDRMAPLGMGGSKKVQDIFVDEKIPGDQRPYVPLFECGGEIIWIPGYRIAQGWEVVPTDAKALQLVIDRCQMRIK